MIALTSVAILGDPNTRPDQLEAACLAAGAWLRNAYAGASAATEFSDAFANLESGTGVAGIPASHVKRAAFAASDSQIQIAAFQFGSPLQRQRPFTYGPAWEPYFPGAIEIADKVLGGTKPGKIRVELPDRYELVINLKARGNSGSRCRRLSGDGGRDDRKLLW